MSYSQFDLDSYQNKEYTLKGKIISDSLQVNFGDQSSDQLDIDFFGIADSSPSFEPNGFDGVLSIKSLFFEDAGTK